MLSVIAGRWVAGSLVRKLLEEQEQPHGTVHLLPPPLHVGEDRQYFGDPQILIVEGWMLLSTVQGTNGTC